MSGAVVAFAALFGLALGSFANAAIDRIPRGASLNGRSHCDVCDATLSARHLIPLVSYALQRGRCALCAAPIGLRTPLVEMGCMLAFAGAFMAFSAPVAAAVCAAVVALVVAAGVTITKRGLHA
jgi:leader peptidase (prepilin peptidase)/N-methyltransferase